MPVVEIASLTTSLLPENLLKGIAKKVLEAEGKKNSSLSIALIGPNRMRKLNKKYLKKNRVTDVLSFPAVKLDFEKPFSFEKKDWQKAEGLGEIIICPHQIRKNARRLNLEFEKELVRCLIHGILHLLGYNHEKDAKVAEKMQEKEEKYLNFLKSEIRNPKHETNSNDRNSKSKTVKILVLVI